MSCRRFRGPLDERGVQSSPTQDQSGIEPTVEPTGFQPVVVQFIIWAMLFDSLGQPKHQAGPDHDERSQSYGNDHGARDSAVEELSVHRWRCLCPNAHRDSGYGDPRVGSTKRRSRIHARSHLGVCAPVCILEGGRGRRSCWSSQSKCGVFSACERIRRKSRIQDQGLEIGARADRVEISVGRQRGTGSPAGGDCLP